jgi:hypothetical protein
MPIVVPYALRPLLDIADSRYRSTGPLGPVDISEASRQSVIYH